ncbi:MAG: hypothetical protein Q8S84_09240 [bacterium]|nr:hypothetical protein [bacterium]MDP3381603.1 hypothetical protein [bacterium]
MNLPSFVVIIFTQATGHSKGAQVIINPKEALVIHHVPKSFSQVADKTDTSI